MARSRELAEEAKEGHEVVKSEAVTHVGPLSFSPKKQQSSQSYEGVLDRHEAAMQRAREIASEAKAAETAKKRKGFTWIGELPSWAKRSSLSHWGSHDSTGTMME